MPGVTGYFTCPGGGEAGKQLFRFRQAALGQIVGIESSRLQGLRSGGPEAQHAARSRSTVLAMCAGNVPCRLKQMWLQRGSAVAAGFVVVPNVAIFKAKLELGAGAHSELFDGAAFEGAKLVAFDVDPTQGGEWQRYDDPVIDLVEDLAIAGQR